MVKAITILVRYANEKGEQEARYNGYLTGGENAMYVNEYNRLMFTRVEPTENPAIYLEVTCPKELGHITDDGDTKTIVEMLARKLHGMTAYDFLARVIIHVQDGFDFNELIIPNLIEIR